LTASVETVLASERRDVDYVNNNIQKIGCKVKSDTAPRAISLAFGK
jgi:hypothetical protein